MTDAYRITGYPRLHLGLIDLSGITRRAYGGAGVAVGGLPTIMTVRRAAEPDLRPDGLSQAARSAIGKALRAAQEAGWDTRVRIEVLHSPPDHVGLGSTTTAVLCALRGTAALHGCTPGRTDLQQLSGRGRTSGIGVNTFFSGGFVTDVGQPREPGWPGYLPSSSSAHKNPSRGLLALPMPADWRASLLLHNTPPTMHGAAEVEFFRRHTPVRPHDSLRMLAELYHGILPAILEEDLGRLSDALRDFQACGFKRAEVDNQPARVREFLAERRPGVACGLSSMGPMIFAIHQKDDFAPAHDDFTRFGPFSFRNEGYECTRDA